MAIENLKAYIKSDPNNKLLVKKNLAKANNTQYRNSWVLWKGFDSTTFAGDFSHKVAARYTAASVGPRGAFWGLSFWPIDFRHMLFPWDEGLFFEGEPINNIFATLFTFGAAGIALKEDRGVYIQTDSYTTISVNTWYYMEIERDEAVGTYGTLYCRIYSDAERTTLLDTLSLSLRAKEDFTVVNAANAWSVADNTSTYTAEFASLDLGFPTGDIVFEPFQLSGSVTNQPNAALAGQLQFEPFVLSGETALGRTAAGDLTFSPLALSGQVQIDRQVSGALLFSPFALNAYALSANEILASGQLVFEPLSLSSTLEHDILPLANSTLVFAPLELSGSVSVTRNVTGTLTFSPMTLPLSNPNTQLERKASGELVFASFEVHGPVFASASRAYGELLFEPFSLSGEAARTVNVTGSLEFSPLVLDTETQHISKIKLVTGALSFSAFQLDSETIDTGGQGLTYQDKRLRKLNYMRRLASGSLIGVKLKRPR